MKMERIFLKMVRNDQWIFLFMGACLFVFFQFVIDFNGLYGQDSHAYYQYSMKINAMLKGESGNLGFFYWPKLYPFLGALIGLTGIPILLALQLISLFSFVGSLVYTQKLIHLYYQKSGALFLFLSAASQIYFLRGGVYVMSDMLATFFCIYALYVYSRFIMAGSWKYAILFFLVAVCAFFTRYPTGILLLIPATHLTYLIFRKSPVFFRPVFIAVVIGLIFFLAQMNGNFLASLSHLLGTWSPFRIVSRTFNTPDGITHNLVPNGMYVLGNFFHIGYLSFGVFLLPFFSLRGRIMLVVKISVIAYLLFLAGHEMQNYRFLMIVHPFVLLLLFPAFDALKKWLKERGFLVIFVLGVILVNVVFGVYSFQKTWKVHSTERELVNALRNVDQNQLVYSFYVDQAFRSYGFNSRVNNFFYDDYYTYEKGALVVFNEEKFERQWKGHRVMSNWERLKSTYTLDTVSVHSDNWVIYRIK